MLPKQFSDFVENNYKYNVKFNSNWTFAEELERAYYTQWYDWDSIGSYISHPAARMDNIAEIWRYSPDIVESHSRWPEISSYKDWQQLIQQPERDLLPLNFNRWGRLPAFYVKHLFAQQDVKAIIRILDSEYLDINFYERWSSQLLAFDNHSINLRLIKLEGITPVVKKELLSTFSKSKSTNVRLAVARHELTDSNVLITLCKDSDEKIAKAAVENPSFPQDAMALVAEQEEAKQLSKLDNLSGLAWKEMSDFLLHPDFPAEGLDILFEQDDLAVRFACAMHPNASEALKHKILTQEEAWKKAAIALNPSTPEAQLRELALIDDFDIAFALVSNPHLPEDLQLIFAKHSNRTVRLHLADCTHSRAVLTAIASHPIPEGMHTGLEQLLAIAINPKTPAAKLGALQTATHISRSNGEVLSTCISNAIAAHANFPDKLIGRYRYYNWPQLEKNKIIQLRVLEGMPLPEPEPVPDWKFNGPAILKFPGFIANNLLLSGDETILRMACSHIGCNKNLLFPLWHAQDTLILKKLAQRPDLPRFFYEILWLHGGDPVKAVLKVNKEALSRGVSFASNKQSPKTKVVLKKNAIGEKDKIVISGVKKDRMELARTSKDEAILQALATDKFSEVRWQLLKQEELPWSVIEILARDSEEDIRSYLSEFFLKFPLEQTIALEELLFQQGGEVAKDIARHTRSEKIQLEALKSYADSMIYNDFLHPSVLEYYLYNGSIYQLAEIAGNIKNQTEFSIKVVDLLFQITENYQSDTTAGISVLYQNPNKEEKSNYQKRLASYLEQKDMRIDSIEFEARFLAQQFVELSALQAIAQRIFSNSSTSIDNRSWAISVAKELPEETLLSLLNGNVNDKRALAINPYISVAIIEKLSEDSDDEVRSNIAQYHAGNASRLIADESEKVRCALAEFTADVNIQQIISKNSSENVLAALASNVFFRSDLLFELIQKSKSYSVRRNAINNENITNETLILLLKDRNSSIREAAQSKLDERGIAL